MLTPAPATLPDWGHIENGIFVPLPREPMERAGLGPPPFEVTLPDGRVRVVVERAEGESAEADAP